MHMRNYTRRFIHPSNAHKTSAPCRELLFYSLGPRSAPSGEASLNVRMKCLGRVTTDSELVPQGIRSAMVVAVSDEDHLREGNQALRSH